MKSITIYETSTGNILRWVVVPDDMADLQVKPGESKVDGIYPSDQFSVVNGVPTPKPQVTDVAILAPLAVDRVNFRTGEHILERYPDWKQRNFTARAVELVADGTDVTTNSEWVALQAAWDWIKSVRAASNVANAAIAAAADAAGITAAETAFYAQLQLL